MQHFKGLLIKTEEPAFNPSEATLMDFRVSQQHGTTFMYVLPVSGTRALVEYTLFTKELLEAEEYVVAIKDYISSYLKVTNYNVFGEEFGVIPMTNIKFLKQIGRVINMGTAGGQTKGSSGYTFQFIQKQLKNWFLSLLKYGHPT